MQKLIEKDTHFTTDLLLDSIQVAISVINRSGNLIYNNVPAKKIFNQWNKNSGHSYNLFSPQFLKQSPNFKNNSKDVYERPFQIEWNTSEHSYISHFTPYLGHVDYIVVTSFDQTQSFIEMNWQEIVNSHLEEGLYGIDQAIKNSLEGQGRSAHISTLVETNIRDLLEKITELKSTSSNIMLTTREILSIMENTKIIALNTNIEASRGSSQMNSAVGTFSSLANEIKSLANKTSQVAKKVTKEIVRMSKTISYCSKSASDMIQKIELENSNNIKDGGALVKFKQIQDNIEHILQRLHHKYTISEDDIYRKVSICNIMTNYYCTSVLKDEESLGKFKSIDIITFEHKSFDDCFIIIQDLLIRIGDLFEKEHASETFENSHLSRFQLTIYTDQLYKVLTAHFSTLKIEFPSNIESVIYLHKNVDNIYQQLDLLNRKFAFIENNQSQ